MAITTFDQLARLPTRKSAQTVIGEVIYNYPRLPVEPPPTVFLSYKTHPEDWPRVQKIAGILEREEAVPYVDRRDHRVLTMGPTLLSDHFRDRIEECGRLIVVLTGETRRSRWVPWKLGIADGMFGPERAALWPVEHDPERPLWLKQEYFARYPTVEWLKLRRAARPNWCVRNPASGRYWTLARWLALDEEA